MTTPSTRERPAHRTPPSSKPNAWRLLKPLTDAALIVLAFILAYWMRYELQWIRAVEPASLVPLRVYVPSIALLTCVTLFAFWTEGAYRARRALSLLDDLQIALKGALIGVAVMTIVIFYVRPYFYSRLIFAYAGTATLLLIWVSRAVENVVRTRRLRQGLGATRTLLVGAGENARTIMRAIVARPELGYQIVGFVDDDPALATTTIGRYPALGTIAQLAEVLDSHQVDEVIVTLPWMSHREIVQIMDHCERRNVRARIVPDPFQMTLRSVVVDDIDGVPLLGVAEPQLRDWQLAIKRALDVLISGVLLVVLAPVFLLIALAIKLDSPGPVLYKQRRVGAGGVEFTCIKFRTMCVNADQMRAQLADKNEATGPLFKMRNDPRRTRVGRFLRHGPDEFPQLWNVLKGEMSLVGPRPPLPSEVAAYEPWHLRRLDVLPGITGLWQVSGRSNLTFDEMVLLDLYYIENWSPLLDLRILLKTLPVIVTGTGGY